MSRRVFLLAALAGAWALAAAPAHAQVGRTVSFTKDVLPIFQKRCTICHGAQGQGNLRLDSFQSLMTGGKSGQVVQPGNPTASRLLGMVEGRIQPRMPAGGAQPLTIPEKTILRYWVQQGAKDDTDPTAGAAKAAQKPLSILEPKDGSPVRENVKIVVPRASVPPEGFAAIYVDGKFKVALAPPLAEELEEKKLPADSPVVYVWDTKAPLSEDRTLAVEDRFPADGPHNIEVRTYKSDATEAERVVAQVVLQNNIEHEANKPVPLTYAADTRAVGRQYRMEHVVDLDANAGESGLRRYGQPAAPTAGGPTKLAHRETSRYLVSVEDIAASNGMAFMRERRESPIIVVVNGLKQIVRFDSSSRYYALERNGTAHRSHQMERENREPIVNPIDLPGRSQRMNEPFDTTLRVNLGAYIPSVLAIKRIQANVDGLEWQFGEPCARIKLTYLAGNAKVDINSLNIHGADLNVENGTSTIWFSTTTNRVLKVKHEIIGNLVVDVAQLGGGSAGGEGGLGGEMAPGGMSGFPGGMPGYPGAAGSEAGVGPMAGGFGPMSGGFGPMSGGFGARMPYGGSSGGPSPAGGARMPYGGAGGARMPYGAPGGTSGYGGPGGYPGAPGGGAYGSPGSPGGAYPGAPGGYGGSMMPGGYGMGASGMGGGAAAGPPPTTKRYHVNLKVTSALIPEEPGDNKGKK